MTCSVTVTAVNCMMIVQVKTVKWQENLYIINLFNNQIFSSCEWFYDLQLFDDCTHVKTEKWQECCVFLTLYVNLLLTLKIVFVLTLLAAHEVILLLAHIRRKPHRHFAVYRRWRWHFCVVRAFARFFLFYLFSVFQKAGGRRQVFTASCKVLLQNARL